ncbi:hypothetical protein AVEN_82772-1 [Araneus ventricosus]|uniref:Uncharacterized protein n=1 Tax=Araneus ventricosus TaxID=182803 RepID=A0A4Y2DBP1_ARAVE|nr:hypothetical protein AVEN_82772-1 [Araneus ventricosus]
MILVSTYITQSLHFILLALNLMVQYLLEDHLCLPRHAKIKTSQLNDRAYWFIIIILITINYLNLPVIAVVFLDNEDTTLNKTVWPSYSCNFPCIPSCHSLMRRNCSSGWS